MPIHYEQHDEHIVLITIDRPEARNSLDLYHFRDLAEAWRRFRDDDDAWVAIVTGVARQLHGRRRPQDLHPADHRAAAADRSRATSTRSTAAGSSDGTDAVLRNLKIYKPIIAAVDGPCVAGGMEMLGGVDIRIATERATFGVMEPKRGLFAGGGTTVRLPRQLAFPAAMEFLLTAEAFPAARALELGPAQRDRARATSCSTGRSSGPRRITANAPLAVQATKESVLRGLAVDQRRGLRDRERAGRQGVRQRGRQGGPEGVRREARARAGPGR